MFKIPIVNIYNFVRQSHTHPSIFFEDDYITLKNQIIVAKYYGLPSTTALKYDALMNPDYQELLKTYLDENDEISAWWEISEELCLKAGVDYKYSKDSKYDDGVSRIYSLGYSPRERIKLVDAYMEAFKKVFGYYPKTIGSWVLDEVTITYAKEKYNVIAIAICRDQLGTDGFSLWGGYMSGPYFGNKDNLFLPSNKKENQLDLPIFRLLGPDPIYNSESQVRPGLFGVYTFEPASIRGRGLHIDWNFDRINIEDSLGPNYLQVGQENNFLWPNIRPGYIDQIKKLRKLVDENKIVLQTMAQTGKEFSSIYKMTPPASIMASADWNKDNNLQVLNYNSKFYRTSFLIEDDFLRIRELFMFVDGYKSRYMDESTNDKLAIFDSLPVLNPQVMQEKNVSRPFIRILDKELKEIKSKHKMGSLNQTNAYIDINDYGQIKIKANEIEFNGDFVLKFDYSKHIKPTDNTLSMVYREFKYKIDVSQGAIKVLDNILYIYNMDSKIILSFNQDDDIQLDNKYDIKANFTMSLIKEIGQVLSDEYKNLMDKDRESIKGTDIIEKYKDRLIIPKSIHTKSEIERHSTYAQDLNHLADYDKIASLDYIDGRWIAVKEDLVLNFKFSKEILLDRIYVGALFNHRQGIVYPKSIQVEDQSKVLAELDLKDYRPNKEIDKENFEILLGIYTKEVKLIMKDYEIMPQWAFYKGTKPVFNFIDKVYFITGEDDK